MLYQIQAYLSFLLRSTNEHGVHSPFVYDLVTRCFYDTSKYPEYTILKKYRRKLYESDAVIEVTDFGAGSRVFSSNRRKIAAIAKNAGIPEKRQRLLFRLSRYLKPASVLELGTSLGLATTALALGSPSAEITTIERCHRTAAAAGRGFKDFELDNVDIQIKSFEEFFKQTGNKTFDLVYIDGHHSKESTLQLFENLLPHRNDRSVFIFDDIYWSRGMTEAWKEIVKHPEVTVSIDCFYWGIITFRPAFEKATHAQQKQHFSIRL
jgi:predicted O-methyltransferase YrrM